MGSSRNLAGGVVLTVPEFGSLAVRGVLAATFLIAGTAKLTNRRASNQALRDFGAPRLLIAVLPPVEIAVGAGLLFAASTIFAAWAAGALLVMFIAGIAVNLARGRQPPCNCFGQLHSKPISLRTLVRNGVLAAGAAWLIVSGPAPPAADLWLFLGRLDAHGRKVAMVLAAVIALAMMLVLREQDEQEEPDSAPLFDDDDPEPVAPYRPAAVVSRTESPPSTPAAPEKVLTGCGLAIGTTAPDFVLPDLDGRLHALDSVRASGKPLVIVFSSPHCESCRALVPKLPGLAAAHEDACRIILISRGSVQQNAVEKATNPGALLVLLQRDNEVAEAYDCTLTPSAVVVDAGGAIQSPLVVGARAITQLIVSQSKQ